MSSSSQTGDEWEQGCSCGLSASTEPMVLCDIENGCGKWWHHACVDLTVGAIEHVDRFCCPACEKAGLGPIERNNVDSNDENGDSEYAPTPIKYRERRARSAQRMPQSGGQSFAPALQVARTGVSTQAESGSNNGEAVDGRPQDGQQDEEEDDEEEMQLAFKHDSNNSEDGNSHGDPGNDTSSNHGSDSSEDGFSAAGPRSERESSLGTDADGDSEMADGEGDNVSEASSDHYCSLLDEVILDGQDELMDNDYPRESSFFDRPASLSPLASPSWDW